MGECSIKCTPIVTVRRNSFQTYKPPDRNTLLIVTSPQKSTKQARAHPPEKIPHRGYQTWTQRQASQSPVNHSPHGKYIKKTHGTEQGLLDCFTCTAHTKAVSSERICQSRNGLAAKMKGMNEWKMEDGR